MTAVIQAQVEVVRPPWLDGTAWRAVTALAIDPAEPVFRGHYPGFPIFPGLCVVECVRRSADVAGPPGAPGLRLAAMEAVRFVGPVFPGDVLTVELEWRAVGPAWRCTAQARSQPQGSSQHSDAATVRLRYQEKVGS